VHFISAQLEKQLAEVQSERDSAVRSNDHLRKCLSSHHQTLERTLQQTQRALQEQYSLLHKQDVVIQVSFSLVGNALKSFSPPHNPVRDT
jgi:hypothetical protein